MNRDRIERDPSIVFTCNDPSSEEINESIEMGCEDAAEVMYDHATFFRCGECKPSIKKLVGNNKHRDPLPSKKVF
ncbi:MAG: NAD(P)H-nitrite reductase large subunit [Oceanicoccus sp.]|jgi:NAD(P)H-nitrite reductase large subunit